MEVEVHSAPRRQAPSHEIKMFKKAIQNENQFLKDAAKEKTRQFDDINKNNEDLKKTIGQRDSAMAKRQKLIEDLRRQLLEANEKRLENKVGLDKALKDLELERFQGDTLTEELGRLKSEVLKLRAENSRLKEKCRGLKDDSLERANEVQLKQKEVLFLEKEREKRKQRIRVLEDLAGEKDKELEQRSKNEKDLKVQNYKLADRVDELERMMAGVRQDTDQFKYRSENDLELFKQREDEKNRELVKLKAKLKDLEVENEDLEAELYERRKQAERAEQNAKNARLQEEKEKAKADRLEDKAEDLKNQIDNIDTQEAVYQTKIE